MLGVRGAQVWGAADTLTLLPTAQQAYMTHALGLILQRLGKAGLEAAPGLLPALLSGVSARLDSPQEPIRCAIIASDMPWCPCGAWLRPAGPVKYRGSRGLLRLQAPGHARGAGLLGCGGCIARAAVLGHGQLGAAA